MTTKALAGPRIKTALPGPKAKRILSGDEKYISPSYTRSYPLVAKQGHGIVITDVDGNEFFDFSAGIAVTSTGHCHPDVVAAIQKQAGELIQPWCLAISRRLKISALASFVPPYPTLGEASKRAAGSYFTETLFGPRTRGLVRFLARLPVW